MSKRGQAALEFLMTYGWAILVVLLAIGALAYFGVLNPKRSLPDTCIIAPGFSCDDFKVNLDGTATIVVRNGGGKTLGNVTLTLDSVTAKPDDLTCTGVGWSGTLWPDGTVMSCDFAGLAAGVVGDIFSADLVLNYTERGSSLSHKEVGRFNAKYE